ncbi:Vacuolar ATP synthase subunit C [Coelomomyces lativittatus]|nr:Vacuolar ATP synthase subunit C [Coelomomyces lativittatus]
MKYRIDKTLKEIVDTIQQELQQMDSSLKTKSNMYNQVKSNIQVLERKQLGNLAVRSLVDVVRKEHVVPESEYICTMFVAVPRNAYKIWSENYEVLTPMVVPRSTQKVSEDDEYGLFSVVLFHRVFDDFAQKCRELKFLPRDYKFNEKDLELSRKERHDAGLLEKEQWGQLLRLCKTHFAESFSCWCHLKALRIFVESVLRYGLPLDFMSAVLIPNEKHERKAKAVLMNLLSPPDSNSNKKETKELTTAFEEMSLIVGLEKEFLNFVLFQMEFEII